MDCEKARSKAMKIAADAHGVISVAVEIEKNHLVVTGVGVDAAYLTRALQKKVSPATIVSVTVVKPEEKKTEDEKKLLWCQQKPLCCVQYPACRAVYDEEPPLCTIM
ncbi:uncharacterized protein LOC115750159 [Rhodamnia argentea]|uniref:Uncharacterized protein LOC115750159 n=1 Tax=Rhodamnia argentea TaxID=178133 RepID=A0A8B8Q800_9MYRT|nr:uncharacterized protein LOC115750159 [Rhodamnia argentea]